MHLFLRFSLKLKHRMVRVLLLLCSNIWIYLRLQRKDIFAILHIMKYSFFKNFSTMALDQLLGDCDLIDSKTESLNSYFRAERVTELC